MPDVLVNVLTKFNEKGINKFRDSMKTLDKKIIPGIGAGLAGIGAAAAVGFGVAAKETFDFTEQASVAMDELQAATGASAEEMETLEKSAKSVFASGFGEDIGEATAAMGEMQKQTGLTGLALEDATKKALSFSKKLDTDVGDTTNAVATLMKQFGLTSEQAFDFIAKGMQKGLNSSDDFLDSIGEYSNLFAESDATANEFFSLMETGAQGGVLGVDKISDAYKEFGVRVIDISDSTLDALESLGLAGLDDKIGAGLVTTQDAFETVLESLNSLEDPILKNTLGVQLFGTQWEDLGASAFASIDTAKTSLDDMTGAADTATQTGVTLGEQWDIAMRQMVVGMEPIALEMMPLLADGIRNLGDFFIAAQPVFQEFATHLSETMGPATVLMSDALQRIGVALGFASEESTGLDVALKILGGGLDVIVTGIKAVALSAQGIAWVIEQLSEAATIAGGLLDLRNQIISLGADAIGSGLASTASSIGSTLGFAQGGSFTVGGSGGTDSQMVAFNATPGERVTVETPQQQAGGGVTVNVNGVGAADLAAILQNKVSEGIQEYNDNHIVPALTGL